MRGQAKCNIPVKMQYTGQTFDVPLIIGITKEVALENSKEKKSVKKNTCKVTFAGRPSWIHICSQ